MKYLFTFLSLFFIVNVFSQEAASSTNPGIGLSTLVSYNFVGNGASFTNLTPEVHLGFQETYKTGPDFLSGLIHVSPYLGSQINLNKAETFVPGLLLPGNFGLTLNHYFVFTCKENKFYISPANFGMKVISGFTQDLKTILQHNIRPGISYSYSNKLMASLQYTYAWHNTTSESEAVFKQVFNKTYTDLQYVSLTLQTRVADNLFPKNSNNEVASPLYLFCQWKSALDNARYKSLGNNRFLIFGIRSSLELLSGQSTLH